MKKLLNVLVLTLAINFLAAAGGAGFLFVSGKLDKDKLHAIKELLDPPPVTPEIVATASATQPTTQPATAASRLDELLAKYSGRPTGEQADLIQQAVDAQAAALDRRSRELDDLLRQVLREKEELAQRSASLDADRKKLVDEEQRQDALAGDKGFQDSLKLYSAMPGKQAKSAFMAMPDETVARYLQSMPARTATKIIKEFKSPDEQARINRVLDRLRSGGGETPATQPTNAGVAQG